MPIDVNAFVGAYPFRRVPGTSPEALLAAMDRTAIDEAWVTHLPGVFWRDPTEGNAWLLDQRNTNRPGSRYGWGRSITPLMMLKIAVFAPMPSARVATAVVANQPLLASVRAA